MSQGNFTSGSMSLSQIHSSLFSLWVATLDLPEATDEDTEQRQLQLEFHLRKARLLALRLSKDENAKSCLPVNSQFVPEGSIGTAPQGASSPDLEVTGETYPAIQFPVSQQEPEIGAQGGA